MDNAGAAVSTLEGSSADKGVAAWSSTWEPWIEVVLSNPLRVPDAAAALSPVLGADCPLEPHVVDRLAVCRAADPIVIDALLALLPRSLSIPDCPVRALCSSGDCAMLSSQGAAAAPG
eukprot:m51a1_g7359 hypothetical protein (118) ;mRNA; f:38125-38588